MQKEGKGRVNGCTVNVYRQRNGENVDIVNVNRRKIPK